MTEKEYRQHPAISRSALWKIRESPEKFRWAMDHPQEPTPALMFGQVFHKLALEGDSFDSEFAICPNVDKRTKAGKEALAGLIASSDGKTIVPHDVYCKADEMVCALYMAPFVEKLLAGEHEAPVFWKDEMTGEECKARFDAIKSVNGKQIIIDLKTTADASTDGFVREAIRYGYDFQAAMYSEGFEKTNGCKPIFVFIAIEKEPPYAVNILQADDEFIQRGYDIFRELIGTYHECRQSGNWYGYLGSSSAINSLVLPEWLQ